MLNDKLIPKPPLRILKTFYGQYIISNREPKLINKMGRETFYAHILNFDFAYQISYECLLRDLIGYQRLAAT